MNVVAQNLGRSKFTFTWIVVVLVVAMTCDVRGDEKGAVIYRERCASCHGMKGEGAKEGHEKPLVGDASVRELTEVIATTMPEDDPEACAGDDAAAVASYIYSAFYSEAAQLRNDPPQTRLARLTADQLRQSTADLYAHFAGISNAKETGGIKGEYFTTTSQRKDRRKIERVDPQIDFDFGESGPGSGIDAKDYSVRWQGGLLARVTGRYELVLRSSCACMCYFGDYDRELVNNHVQSSGRDEFRRTLWLTAGRVYPLKLIFEQRKRKTKQPPAKVSLSWVPPHGVEEVIPARHFVNDYVKGTFALQTKLPPDDRTYGYERGIRVDRQWDDSITDAAVEFADVAADELWPEFERRNRKLPDANRGRLRAFLHEVVETAFRGPLSEELASSYVDAQIDKTEDDAEAIKRVVLLTFKSPRFLYPLLDRDRSPSMQVANRLALTLFDSLPSDEWLIRQARGDKLVKENEVRAAAERMVDDVRTKAKTRTLFYAWLNIGDVGEIRKDEKAFTEFDAAVVADLRASLDLMLDDVVWTESSDYRRLFNADVRYTTDRLHAYYGDAWKPAEGGVGLRKSVASPANSGGILTHPYLMSHLAYPDSTSPIHRGVFVIRHMLGRALRPPQEAFTPLSPDLHPDLTTRQRVELQTKSESCQVCHVKINALGFTLENFDAVGRVRENERGRAIDVSGGYTDRQGEFVKLDGAGALADYLANSDEAQRAFVDGTFEHFVKQPTAAFGPNRLDELTDAFRKCDCNIRELLVDIAVVAASDTNNNDDK